MTLKLALGVLRTCMGLAPGLALAVEPSESGAILNLAEFSQPSTSVSDWLAQAASDPVRITGVTLEPTERGLDIVLTTAQGQPLAIDATRFRAEGNQLLADLPNVVLALPNGATFQAANPTADIAEIRLVQRELGLVQVVVTGAAGLPRREVALVADGLAYTLNPEAIEPAEELVVTGDRAPGYDLPSASVGSRTNTDSLDLLFSAQVVPEELLRDRQVQSVNEALRTVAGVTPDNPSYSPFEGFTIRGFTGRRDNTNITSLIALSNCAFKSFKYRSQRNADLNLRGYLSSIFQYGSGINCRGSKGLRACRRFACNPRSAVSGSWGTRGLSPLSPTIGARKINRISLTLKNDDTP